MPLVPASVAPTILVYSNSLHFDPANIGLGNASRVDWASFETEKRTVIGRWSNVGGIIEKQTDASRTVCA